MTAFSAPFRGAPGKVTAVLGPTNTGKTHLALERMLGHRTGMIGFPLRLLARENYDRIVRLKGPAHVALITGEERILPPHPRWYVCTVESMPLDRPVEFLAVDEIQLCADWDRGHIFTDRLLHARGLSETMLLGSDTIRPLLKALLPDLEIITRPRLSTLSYAGPKKLTRLPRRSAVVAFSAAEVYAMAETIRRQRGGCAVVLGALSPRARNAQVELYQSGEVDYMVATDAIGMGLNMDLDHVAFARLSKFDGAMPRRLTAPEIAQIAGRAGRHMNDGSFGTLAEIGALDPELVEAVETHRFDPLVALSWRNSDLDFRSVEALLRSLDRPPPAPILKRKREAEDHLLLQALARDADLRETAKTRPLVRLLWDVCQIPDFRKDMMDSHARLVRQIYGHLARPGGRLPTDWVAQQIDRIDSTLGDIDQLSQRIAAVRTWTYISHRPEWLPRAQEWQERARAVEDRLSDALHEKLTQRFVDRRGAMLKRKLDERAPMLAGVRRDGAVLVEGHPVGRLDGFLFTPDSTGEEARALATVARRSLGDEIRRRVADCCADPDHAFSLAPDGRIVWRDAPVARLIAGPHRLAPGLALIASDLLEGEPRERLRDRLHRWVTAHLRTILAPLFALRDAPLGGLARGLAYQLYEAGGVLPRSAAAAVLADLDGPARKALGRLGIALGTETLFLPGLLKPKAAGLLGMLHSIHQAKNHPAAAVPGGVNQRRDPALDDAQYLAMGFLALGPRVVRLDVAERLAQALRHATKDGRLVADDRVRALLGCKPGDVAGMLTALGYRARPVPAEALEGASGAAGVIFTPARRAPGAARKSAKATAPSRPTPPAASPFAALAQWQQREKAIAP